jgi:hypothetical protein
MNIENEIWIGLLGLYPLKNNKYIMQKECAYTNVLIMAYSKKDYLKKAKSFAQWLDFEIFEYENIESLKNRLSSYSIDKELFCLAEEVNKTEQSQIATLYTFEVTWYKKFFVFLKKWLINNIILK